MSATLELFERYKQVIGVQADSAGARALGVKSQTASNWRTRGSQAEPRLIEKMCVMLREDVAPWLLRVQMEQTPDTSNREVWRRVVEKLGYRITGVAAALCIPAAWQSCYTDTSLVDAARIMTYVKAWVDLAIAT